MAYGIKTYTKNSDRTRAARAEKSAKALEKPTVSQNTDWGSLARLAPPRPEGYEAVAQSAAEKKAGVTPAGFQSLRDVQTGELLKQYKIDPFSGEASGRLREEALGTGVSPWAKMALDRQAFEEAQARGNVGLQQQQAQSQAQSALMRQGGLGGGARTSLARSGARDALMAGQQVAGQGVLSRYGINEQDMKRRQELLGQTADVERQTDIKNLGTTTSDIDRRAMFDANRYNQQMQAWAAKQSADATRAAGNSGGKK